MTLVKGIRAMIIEKDNSPKVWTIVTIGFSFATISCLLKKMSVSNSHFRIAKYMKLLLSLNLHIVHIISCILFNNWQWSPPLAEVTNEKLNLFFEPFKEDFELQLPAQDKISRFKSFF